MYISELKMHGFKSFANKEVMKLGQGITTVVGPNGCGKTNIVDAIRWVLGEQKYSVLRSGKMEDVIFNGSEGTKPLGVCEVSMTVHNNAGKLPIEYNDIEIARRVYRSGESEYYLNKTQCRLKDIMDLFVDTGMGADAYSVIELKMIEQILSETGDDRRKMFEEASGIHRYRTQRKSTLRKFEITRTDLERVNDIILEVEQKVSSLGRQLKRFKRHAILTEDLHNKDLDLAFLQVHRFSSVVIPLNARIKEYQHLRESKTSKSSIHEKKIVELQSIYKSQETELNEVQIKMTEMNENRELIRNKILVCTEQGRGALLTIERLERERKNNFQKIESLKQLSLDFEQEMTKIEPDINDRLDVYKTQKNEFIRLEKVYQDLVITFDSTQNNRWELQRKLADDRSLFDRTQAIVDEKAETENKLNQFIKSKDKESDIYNQNQKISLAKEKKAKKDLEDVRLKLKFKQDGVFTLKEDLDELSEEKYTVSAMIKSLQGQGIFYSELVETKEGFPEGTRYVLENPTLFPNVLGTVADMFQVEEEYRDALESGLGDLAHCLIAKDKSSAYSTLKDAQNNQAGDLSIIPLKEAAGLASKLKNIPKNNLIIARASDIVKTSKALKPLSEYLLGNLLIVEELGKANELGTLDGWGLVDRLGSYSGSDMVIKNRQISEHGNLIGRQEKLDSINIEVAHLLLKEKELSTKTDTIINDLSTEQKIIKELQGDLETSNKIVLGLENEAIRDYFKQKQLTDALKDAKGKLHNNNEELEQARIALESLKPSIEDANKKLKLSQQEVETSNQKMLAARKKRDDFQQALQEARIKLIELESRRDQLNFKRSSGDENKAELVLRQDSINKEIKEVGQKKKDLDFEISDSEQELDTFNAEIQKQTSLINLKQSVYRETYQNIEEVQARITAEQRDREQILEDLKNSELEASKIEQKIQLVDERILDRYNEKIPKDKVVDSSEEQLEIEISKIQRSLENIGPVNMAVQDEFNEENERLELLSVQRDDLLDAENNLRDTIRKIDKIARKRFQETFDLIKTNFETLFNLFFEGGNATIKLVGDPDPLEADIAIEAQPPGKRNSSLRLLSSGEKALTAISLLFAIYQVKPSPYCILDEVDAPLDDVNIHKFTKVLAKFCDETQFIIVTHNKLTMEIADFMYGVTQEKKGISKLVSVKFD